MRLPRLRGPYLALAAVTILAATAMPARAFGGVHSELTVSGSASSSVIWSVNRPITLDLSDSPYSPSVQVSGGRRFVGIAISTLGGHLLAALVHPAGFNVDHRPVFVWIGPRQQSLRLAPGQYRVIYLADGPGSVQVTVRSGLPRSVRLRAVNPVANTSSWSDLSDGRAPEGLLTAATLPAQVAARQWTGTFTSNETTGPQDNQAYLCLRPQRRGAPCSFLENDGGASHTTVGLGTSLSIVGRWSAPGALDVGRYTMSAGWRTAGLSQSQAAFTVSFSP